MKVIRRPRPVEDELANQNDALEADDVDDLEETGGLNYQLKSLTKDDLAFFSILFHLLLDPEYIKYLHKKGKNLTLHP